MAVAPVSGSGAQARLRRVLLAILGAGVGMALFLVVGVATAIVFLWVVHFRYLSSLIVSGIGIILAVAALSFGGGPCGLWSADVSSSLSGKHFLGTAVLSLAHGYLGTAGRIHGQAATRDLGALGTEQRDGLLLCHPLKTHAGSVGSSGASAPTRSIRSRSSTRGPMAPSPRSWNIPRSSRIWRTCVSTPA